MHRLSRHVYDAHRIWHTAKLRTNVLDARLLRAVVENKQVFFKETKARYDLVAEFELNCAPHPDLAMAMRTDFGAMESMFFPESSVPTFDEALATLKEIDSVVAGWKTQPPP